MNKITDTDVTIHKKPINDGSNMDSDVKIKKGSSTSNIKGHEVTVIDDYINWVANHAAVTNPIKPEDETLAVERGHLLKETVKNTVGSDPIEAMLVSQMVSLHNHIELGFLIAGAEMKNSGKITGRYPAMHLTNKMLNTYARQVDALNNYRGKTSNQKITVEQVNVGNGGKAIVGNIKAEGRDNDTKKC